MVGAKTIIDDYGFSIGCTTGWFIWPVPACSAHFNNEHGYIEARKPEDAHKICMQYCKLVDNKLNSTLADRYYTMNRKVKSAKTCGDLCDNVLEYIKDAEKKKETEEKESFVHCKKKEKNNLGVLLPIIILPIFFFLIFLALKLKN